MIQAPSLSTPTEVVRCPPTCAKGDAGLATGVSQPFAALHHQVERHSSELNCSNSRLTADLENLSQANFEFPIRRLHRPEPLTCAEQS